MTSLELIVIATGVAMDAFAVSICKGMSVRTLHPRYILSASVWFGGFQALMPLIGYYVGVSFADYVTEFDHWIAFVLLSFIGINMIKEAVSGGEAENDPDFSFKAMFALAVATSIDALAVGVSFAFLKVDIWAAILLIGAVTALFSGAGVAIGNIFGARYKSKAELAGGVILVLIGLKILSESLFRPNIWASSPEVMPSFLRRVSVSIGMFLAVTSALGYLLPISFIVRLSRD